MSFPGLLLLLLLLPVLLLLPSPGAAQHPHTFDIAVYGATPAGITAAVAAARMGHEVVLLASSAHIGGMVTGGLSHTDIIRPSDIDNRLLVGGIAREFFELNTAWYQKPNTTLVWDVEPHVAASLFRQMLDAANVTLLVNASVASATVSRRRSLGNQSAIESIRDHSGRVFAAAVWVDASYEGDLLAAAGVSFALGREPAAEYNESLAGFTGGSSPQFGTHIDPYDGNGALLPLLDALPPALAVGDGDTAVSSYTFRLCITDRADNLVPFEPPARYNRSDWELVRRTLTHDTGRGSGRPGRSGGLAVGPPLPGGLSKYDLNSGGPLGTDFVGAMHGSRPASAWAAANRTTRALMWQEHKDYVQGLLWFRLTEANYLKGFGLCKDEFADSGHWPPQLYIREARRMRGERVVTQSDIVAAENVGDEAVGMGGYVFDTHTARRYACTPGSPTTRAAQCTAVGGGDPGRADKTAYAYDESHMVSDPGLFQLPRSLLLPRRAEATNLAVPVAVSATHVVFSSVRMEPQWMVLGHAAGVLASLALADARDRSAGIRTATPVLQDVPAAKLNAVLRTQGAMLDMPVPPASQPQQRSCMLNRCVPHTASAGPGRDGCQFGSPLKDDEWLAPVADFAATSAGSSNITAQRPTALRKALAAGSTDLAVSAGFSCGRSYLQHFRGVWICIGPPSPPSPSPPPPPSPSPGPPTPAPLAGDTWLAWQPEWQVNSPPSEAGATITAKQNGAVLKKACAPSKSLPANETRFFNAGHVVALTAPPRLTAMCGPQQAYYEVDVELRTHAVDA